MGFATLGSIGSAVYRHDMADVSPAGVSGSALHALRNTVGGAADVASHLSGGAGGQLVATSRDAFTHGMQIACLTGAGLLGLTALLAAFLLRRTPIEAALPGSMDAAQAQEGDYAARQFTRSVARADGSPAAVRRPSAA